MTYFQQYLSVYGNISKLARRLGISHAAVQQWRGVVPYERIIDVERATGIPREALRPELYARDPQPGTPEPKAQAAQ